MCAGMMIAQYICGSLRTILYRVGSLLILIIFYWRIGWRHHALLFLIAHHVFHLNKEVCCLR